MERGRKKNKLRTVRDGADGKTKNDGTRTKKKQTRRNGAGRQKKGGVGGDKKKHKMEENKTR